MLAMLIKIIKKIFGTRNERLIKQYSHMVVAINALESDFRQLSDAELRAKTEVFKERFKQGLTLDALLPEAFAAVREASVRTLGLRHFDVQLIGGIALHQGKVAEMRTGEGKTLVSTLSAYLNALPGKGVHIITVNDYLAKRDAEWMQPIYNFLGLKVGINLPDMDLAAKKAAYAADITYGTNNEFGFDYLRDNMVLSVEEQVQPSLYYAIIDEVDSILIDEARTPLIISGQAEESSALYAKINILIPSLKKQIVTEEEGATVPVPEGEQGDYTVDEKNRQAYLTEQGHQHVEELMVRAGLLEDGDSLYDLSNITLMHYLYASLRAHALYQRDIHYIVQEQSVVIVDEHTGRLMPGRRWSSGLHQAVEAKEGVPIELENQTLATITLQNYFRLYQKLSGMTGTADTEAFELQKIYHLEVVVIPTNQPMIREDAPDQIYLSEEAKFTAIIKAIKAYHAKRQPLLIGTASIEASELISRLLKKDHIPHVILNAKQHEREAEIIAQAGYPSAVTIATNMAGRGTDIMLGGNLNAELAKLESPTEADIKTCKTAWSTQHDQVIALGGLHVIGTERHESRRIDNQLRGRAGRQGDPGSSQFYLSAEDNLLRIFAGERTYNMMRRLGLKADEMIQHRWLTNAVAKAQQRVEAFHFDSRKQLLEYDDVANDQRKVIYQQRSKLLHAEDLSDTIKDIFQTAISDVMSAFIPPKSLEEEWDIAGLEKQLQEDFAIALPIAAWLEDEPQLYAEQLEEKVLESVVHAYHGKIVDIPKESISHIEKTTFLQILDQHWKEHLAAMDYLRQGIHLQGYAQKNPTQEFKRKSFELLTQMLAKIKYDVASALSSLGMTNDVDMATRSLPVNLNYSHPSLDALDKTESEAAGGTDYMQSGGVVQSAHTEPKIGRNQPCPCGSGKKYKQCHGSIS